MNPLGEDGKLRYPPKKSKEEEEEERRELAKAQKKKKAKTPGIISIYELLSEEYRRKEGEKKERTEQRRQTRDKIMLRQTMEFVDDEQMWVTVPGYHRITWYECS